MHFAGVHPDWRRHGLGRRLYEHFFLEVAGRGRTVVRCITAPVNLGSIAFHRSLGFAVEPGDSTENGIPVHTDYDGPGESRVLFVRCV